MPQICSRLINHTNQPHGKLRGSPESWWSQGESNPCLRRERTPTHFVNNLKYRNISALFLLSYLELPLFIPFFKNNHTPNHTEVLDAIR